MIFYFDTSDKCGGKEPKSVTMMGVRDIRDISGFENGGMLTWYLDRKLAKRVLRRLFIDLFIKWKGF